MRLFLSTGAVALALSGPLAAPLLAQQQQPDWNAVQIRTVSLGPGLYVLFGQGGNIGLSVGDDGAFVIDNQFAPLSEKILAAIRAVTPKPVRFVVNTHWHGDHTGGNENFGKAGALIVAHD
ncbi:MAG: MBL fold metallo-hydrolase, partial [Gemmatimonadales bacterium]|nr:MBL fold metallo-hydrolase [Gemmatimonadales bacterium]